MKTADLAVGMEVAIGPPSMEWGVKRAVILGFGWEENRWTYARGYRFAPTRDGKGGIAVAVLHELRFTREDSPSWEPDIVKPQQIRGPWAEIKAEQDRKDAAARAARLAEAARNEAFTARVDAVEARLSEFEGDVVVVRSQGDRLLLSIDLVERLLDRIDRISDDTADAFLRGVRSADG